MKFCYVDESGTGSEPFLVMTGVVVDAQRMHVTKDDWGEVLEALSTVTGRTIHEFHTKDFYAGNGPWRGMDGNHRARVIQAILGWWGDRHHHVTFSGIDKQKHAVKLVEGSLPEGCETPWRAAALHVILSVQKRHRGQKKNKGHTMLLFDRELKEETSLSALIARPPGWTDEYYDRHKRQAQLDQIIDVPFFGDSRQVLLVQVADLISYVLRRYAEIEEGKVSEHYKGERDRLSAWVELIEDRCFPVSTRWPSKGLTEPDRMFQDLAPDSLHRIGRDNE